MSETQTIQESVAEFRQTAVGFGFQLRHHLAQIILNNLKRLDWNQKQLADASGKPQTYISRLIHSDANFQADVAGAILHALDVRARERGLRVEPAIYNPGTYMLVPIDLEPFLPLHPPITTGSPHGQKITFKEDTGQAVRFTRSRAG